MHNALDPIDPQAKALRAARDVLAERANALQREIESAHARKLPGIRKAVADVADADAALKASIVKQPQLFERPRSVVLHGLKFGFRKGSGKITIDDEENVVKLIRKHFPQQFKVLCETTVKPVKKALQQLSVADLKKIGINVEATGDVPFVSDTAAGVDKLVKALLKSAEEATEQEAA